MQEMFLGEVIRQRRTELGLTQEQLCEGICEPMTISRFERGKQTPSRTRINAILQRLGLPDDRYYALLSKNEVTISSLEKEIVACNIQFERAAGADKPRIRREALEKIRQLENIIDKDDSVSHQMILRSVVLLGGEDGSMGHQEKIETLLKAICLTSSHFDLEEISNGLYTDAEIKIINQIAIIYSAFGNHHQAIDILKQLLRYIHLHLQNIPPTRAHIPLVTFNYSHELAIVGRYADAIELAQQGRDICTKYGHYQFLPDFLAIIAGCYYYMENYPQSADYYRQAYYLYKAIGDDHNRSIIQKEAKDFLHLELQ